IAERVRREVGEDEGGIFRAHRQLLREAGREAPLVAKVKTMIHQKRMNASAALHAVLDEYAILFAKIPDPYLREKLSDIKDVVGRVQAYLSCDENHSKPAAAEEPVILVAAEILASQAVRFDALPVPGLI